MPDVYGDAPGYFAAGRVQQRESTTVLCSAPADSAGTKEQLLGDKFLCLLAVQLRRQNARRVQ